MELTELTRGRLKVKDGDHFATIYGEALLRGVGALDFLIYKNTLEKWDAPHEAELMDDAQKATIIRFLREEFAARKMFVEFE